MEIALESMFTEGRQIWRLSRGLSNQKEITRVADGLYKISSLYKPSSTAPGIQSEAVYKISEDGIYCVGQYIVSFSEADTNKRHSPHA